MFFDKSYQPYGWLRTISTIWMVTNHINHKQVHVHKQLRLQDLHHATTITACTYILGLFFQSFFIDHFLNDWKNMSIRSYCPKRQASEYCNCTF